MKEQSGWVVWARGIWSSLTEKEAYETLRKAPFRASKAVANELAGRGYFALPRWVKQAFKRQARVARAAAKP